MRKGWKCTLTAALLIFSVLTVLMVNDRTAKAVEPDRELTVSYPDGAYAEIGDENVVVIDLYKVADVRLQSDFGYEVDPDSPYGDLKTKDGITLAEKLSSMTSSLTNDDWREISGLVGEAVLKSNSIQPAARIGVKETWENPPNGLYLLIAHGKQDAQGNELSKDDYVTKVVSGDEESIATIARSQRYEYTFLPELISYPGKEPVNGESNTAANWGDWVYKQTVMLKPEEKRRLGSLEIVKTLDAYETGSRAATFVFQIEAELDKKNVYSDTVGITFDGTGQKTVKLIDKIPVGAEVTVTEVYSGSSYKLTTEETQTATIVADEANPASVYFTNTYNDVKHGYGIVNHIFINEEGNWDYDNTHDSTVNHGDTAGNGDVSEDDNKQAQ